MQHFNGWYWWLIIRDTENIWSRYPLGARLKRKWPHFTSNQQTKSRISDATFGLFYCEILSKVFHPGKRHWGHYSRCVLLKNDVYLEKPSIQKSNSTYRCLLMFIEYTVRWANNPQHSWWAEQSAAINKSRRSVMIVGSLWNSLFYALLNACSI